MSRGGPQIVTCPGCGVRRQWKPTRGDDKYCRHCRHVYTAAAEYVPNWRDGLTGGRWVLDGLTLRFEKVKRIDTRRATCRCGREMHRQSAMCWICWRTVNRDRTRVLNLDQVDSCEICGCILAPSDDMCPGCLAWAEKEAVAASWRAATEHYKPRQVALREVA